TSPDHNRRLAETGEGAPRPAPCPAERPLRRRQPPAGRRLRAARAAAHRRPGVPLSAGRTLTEPRPARRTSMSDDERAIRDLVATWMVASKAGDLATVLTLMSDDVVFMVPGREPFGKAAFAAASEGMKGVQ